MTSEVESKLVSRRRISPFLGVAAAAGLALRYTAAEAQTSGSEAQTSGSKALTPGAARRGGRVERRYERRGGTPASKQPAQGQPAQGQATQAQPGGQKQ
jgi:hypothetical protein